MVPLGAPPPTPPPTPAPPSVNTRVRRGRKGARTHTPYPVLPERGIRWLGLTLEVSRTNGQVVYIWVVSWQERSRKHIETKRSTDTTEQWASQVRASRASWASGPVIRQTSGEAEPDGKFFAPRYKYKRSPITLQKIGAAIPEYANSRASLIFRHPEPRKVPAMDYTCSDCGKTFSRSINRRSTPHAGSHGQRSRSGPATLCGRVACIGQKRAVAETWHVSRFGRIHTGGGESPIEVPTFPRCERTCMNVHGQERLSTGHMRDGPRVRSRLPPLAGQVAWPVEGFNRSECSGSSRR
ncbi:hypothetical protein C7M84_006556 [Penaeus vannamei]|uniref:C2H2-type domain-containing protein n=1 Tax=Penaeus vannamei TaxID=6689 RepID=A0A3R7M7C3_PENVA|nr:hypothetical protein C7M84_006556 [Penaeus vannamei]